MKTTIISDSSSLIILGKLARVDLLTNLFAQITIPKRVAEEISIKEDGVAKVILANSCFTIGQATNADLLALLDGILDYGEAEAIALAEESQQLLLVDEKKARKIAKKRHLKIIGLLGVLIANCRHNYISNLEAITLKDQIKQFGFRLSPQLEKDFLTILADKS